MKKKFDILVVGELNVDIILDKVDGFPEIGKEKLAEKLHFTLGSSAAIFASNLSTLGAKVAFIGKTGQDRFAEFIISSLRDKDVFTDFIIKSGQYSTGATVVLNYEMDRAMITYPGAMEHLLESEVKNDILSEAHHIHVSSVFLQPALKKDLVTLFSRAKSLGLTTSLDPQWDPAEKWDLELEKLLPYVDVFLPNRKELQFLTRTDSIDASIDKIKAFANIIAIKDGENGAHLWKNGSLITKQAFLNKEVADCIGAGDSFDAGFISKYIQEIDLTECLEFANLTGAINTTKYGGTTAFQSLKAVKKVAAERFNQKI